MNAPKSAKLRLVEGNRGHRPIPKKKAKTRKLMPACPRWLSPIAKTEWKRAAPLLFDIGLLCREDMVAFSGYCENYAILVQCGNYIQKKGGYAKYLAGTNSQTAPHTTAMNKAFTMVKVFAAEFGLTPSSRGRIEIPEAPSGGDVDLD